MLGTIKSEKDLTVDLFRSILDAVHVEGARGNTLYSNVFDLKNGLIYLYHWHQFDEVVTLSVEEELRGMRSPTRISSLFSAETVKKASEEHTRYKSKSQRGRGPWPKCFSAALCARGRVARLYALRRGGIEMTSSLDHT
jgi:hypothetical protein